MDCAVPNDPWSLERRCVSIGLPALGFLGFLGFPYLGRDALHWFPLFLVWAGWLVGVPAWVVARRLNSPSPLERLGFGATFSIVGLALAQFAAMELGVRQAVFAYPLVLCLLTFRRGTLSPRIGIHEDLKARGQRATAEVEPMPATALCGGVLAFTMAIGVMTILPSFYPARAPVLDEHRKTRCVKVLPDLLLHLQAQEEMSHTWPPQLSAAAGTPLRYHLAADAIALALTPPGVPRLAVNCHFMPTLWHLLMAGNSLLLARRYLGATGLAGLFPILAVFGEDFGWLVPILELPMVPSLPTFPSFFWFNPNLPGLAVLMGGLAALGARLNTFVAVCLLGGAALFKVFIGVQAGFAVAFAGLLCGAVPRRRLAAIFAGVALFGAVLAALYRHTFESPNQHMRFEPLAEMRMCDWFVPVVLGLRMIGLGELLWIPLRASREGPLRVAVAGLILTGAAGLFVRISAMISPGLLGYNNGVWLGVVAKVPMWLLVLGAIQRGMAFRSRSRTSKALGMAFALFVAAVAVRGSWPFLKFQRDNPEVATPPHVIGPEDLEVPQWLERSVPPGTVVVCDPTFPLSLTALSPYRTPCPQGGEFAYAISFMTIVDHSQRVSDAEQFWGEWSCGGLPSDYLGKYRVGWVITRADVACPNGMQPVFRNGSWAIYEGLPRKSVDIAGR
jgi:hypothetical protein